MANKSGLTKQTDINATENKVAYSAQATDPTQTQINVQLVGDQGTLSWYNSQAKMTIEDLGKIASSDMTDSQRIDLARALTVYGQSDPTFVNYNSLSNATLAGTNTTYWQIGNDRGINIEWTKSDNFVPYTAINGVNNPWGENNPNAVPQPGSQQALDCTKFISNYNFHM